MNILNALKQLRDDIKTWVTVNLNALNAKIDEKTIPIDSELSSTSTNPVQNQAIAKEIDSINGRVGSTPVATQIANAIDKVPTFSGDYNDLTNAPNIAEDDSGSMVIADESGNIIFKADADGMHTTAVSINGEAAATEKYVDDAVANIEFPTTDLTDYATKKYVDDAIDGIEIPDVDFTGYATETYVDNKVADLVNSAPEALNTLGELAIALEIHEDAYDALLETVGGKATHADLENLKEELSESIVAETDEFHIVDESGNIVASIDENGVTTTTVTAQSVIVNGNSVEEHIDNDDIHVTAAEKEAWNNKSDFSGNYNDLSNKPTLFSGSYNDLTDKPAPTDLSNYYTKTEVDTAIENVEVDLTGYATEDYVNTAINNIDFPETDLGDYYTKIETDTAIESAKEELSESIVSESEEWKVVDNAGNIVATISSAGIETTTVIAQSVVVNGVDVESNLGDSQYIKDISVNQDDSSITLTRGDSTTSVVKQPKKAVSLFAEDPTLITNAGYGQFCFQTPSYTPYVYASVVQYNVMNYDGTGITIASTTDLSYDLASAYLHYILDVDSNVVYSLSGSTARSIADCDLYVSSGSVTANYIPFTNAWNEFHSNHTYKLCLMAWQEISLPAAESASF